MGHPETLAFGRDEKLDAETLAPAKAVIDAAAEELTGDSILSIQRSDDRNQSDRGCDKVVGNTSAAGEYYCLSSKQLFHLDKHRRALTGRHLKHHGSARDGQINLP